MVYKTRFTEGAQPFKGKVVWVSGAANGIGEAVAKRLCVLGATVKGFDLPREAVKLKEIARDFPNFDYFLADLTDEIATEDVAQEAAAASNGVVDILFANAGVAGLCPPIGGNRKVRRLTNRVNIEATSNFIESGGKYVFCSRGLIAITSSMAKYFPVPGADVYNATKAYLHVYGDEGLRMLARAYKSRVLMIYPNPVDTRMTDGFDIMPEWLVKLLIHRVDLEEATEAIVWAMHKRKKRVFVPEWLGRVRLLLPLAWFAFKTVTYPVLPWIIRHEQKVAHKAQPSTDQ